MKRAWLLSLFCLALGIGNARADVIVGTTNPGLFTDSVDWCANFGCTGQALPTPSAWTSAGGNTGYIGTTNGFQPTYVLEQGVTFNGDFPEGMGLIYNGAQFGNNTPSPDIAAEFNTDLDGAGAWIQSNFYGAFTATISLYDDAFNLIGSYTTTGVASDVPGTALFIGAYDSTGANVGAVVFDAVGIGDFEPDFAIGTMELLPNAPVPEPTSVVLLLSILGCLSIGAGRKIRKSLEVS